MVVPPHRTAVLAPVLALAAACQSPRSGALPADAPALDAAADADGATPVACGPAARLITDELVEPDWIVPEDAVGETFDADATACSARQLVWVELRLAEDTRPPFPLELELEDCTTGEVEIGRTNCSLVEAPCRYVFADLAWDDCEPRRFTWRARAPSGPRPADLVVAVLDPLE